VALARWRGTAGAGTLRAMEHVISFTVPGLPRGKGRPRFSVQGGFARAYTDAQTRSYEAEVKACAIQAGATPIDGPVRIEVRAYFPIPKSYPKWVAAACASEQFRYVKKPDTDNLSKIKDALNGVAWADDSQVYDERVMKAYSACPRLEVTIWYERQPLRAAG
jgi:Holliday junction resolvase RusA-like endonuclease